MEGEESGEKSRCNGNELRGAHWWLLLILLLFGRGSNCQLVLHSLDGSAAVFIASILLVRFAANDQNKRPNGLVLQQQVIKVICLLFNRETSHRLFRFEEAQMSSSIADS